MRLAYRAMLLLGELPESNRQLLEAMTHPLENGVVSPDRGWFGRGLPAPTHQFPTNSPDSAVWCAKNAHLVA
jgi:magnesium chelatase subunit ChlI-like protein